MYIRVNNTIVRERERELKLYDDGRIGNTSVPQNRQIYIRSYITWVKSFVRWSRVHLVRPDYNMLAFWPKQYNVSLDFKIRNERH